MKIAISQPTYLPWLGYFDLMDQVDIFVFLDTVQFDKRSWQQRNRIKVPEGLLYLTVPVVVKGRFAQRIKDVEIESAYFIAKHLRSIETNYRRAPFFEKYFPELAAIFEMCSDHLRLADLNIRLIKWMSETLGIKTAVHRSSEIAHEGSRSELLLSLCRTLNADDYISALGSANYLLGDLPLFLSAAIKVYFQDYEHPQYGQLFPPFQSHASTLDLIFNEGDRALEILRSGRKPVMLPVDVHPVETEAIARS